jgi:Glycine-rich protein domain (DUF2403)/Putative TOS1-like glycosyl hydrolase (DUF2401)
MRLFASAGVVVLLGLGANACSPSSAPGVSDAGEGTAGARTQGGAASQGGAGSPHGGAREPSSGEGPGGASSGGATAGASSGGGTSSDPALGPARFGEGDLDAVSDGGTLTFQNLGKAGFYPSRRDPVSGACDAYENGACCMTKQEVASDELTPWNEELIVTLRGPIQLKQFVVYTSQDEQSWNVQSAWDSEKPAEAFGVAFDGAATPGADFAGTVGSECLTDVMTDEQFPCGPGSVPYCPAEGSGPKNYGWSGSKLFVMAARMPLMGGSELDAATACGTGTSNGWYNAPWLGISLGELIREGKFGDCNCYGRTPQDWYAGDGCGQINAFEVVNDNNDYQNFDVFSSNVFSYAGNVGEGPCGKNCNLAGVGPADLIDKSTSMPASQGGITTQGGAYAHVAFRRPTRGYRYILALLDVRTRQMQLAIIHPSKVPAAAAGLLPNLPRSLGRATIDALLGMRLPG